jgi:bifunctional non-homologous end joining protein LigD
MEQEFVIGGYIPGSPGFDALLVGAYENKQLIFVAKVKDGFVPRIRKRNLPGSQKAESCPLPFQKLAREEGLAMGRVADCGKDEGMLLGSPRNWSAGSRLSNGPMLGI